MLIRKTLAALAIAALALAGCGTTRDNEAVVTVTKTAQSPSKASTTAISESETNTEEAQPDAREQAPAPEVAPAGGAGVVTTEVIVTCEEGAVVAHWTGCIFVHDTGDQYTPTIPEQIPDLPLYEPAPYEPPAYDSALEEIAGDSNIFATGPGY